MNKFLFLLLCLTATAVQAVAQADATSSDTVVFQNGDALKGTLQSLTTNSLQWQRADTAQPINFDLEHITRIDFASHTSPSVTTPCRVRLSNEDLLEGTLFSCDNYSLVLDTWYAGRLVIPRKNVRSLTLVPPPQTALFDGPTGTEGWTQGKSALAPDSGQWSFRNNAFYASKPASIARDLKLPDQSSLQFDLRWQGTLHAAIALYADSLLPVSLAAKENEPDFGGFYSFQINSAFAELIAITKREPNRLLGPVMIAGLGATNAAHIELRTSKAKHTIWLLINGTVVKEWVDPVGFIGNGTAVRFVHQGLGTIRLNNLRLTKWNGVLESKTEVANTIQDVASFANGSLLAGRFQSITNGQITLLTVDKKATAPFSELRQLDFSKDTVLGVARAPGELRAGLAGTGRLTFQIEQWTKNAVTGTNSILGRIKCNPAAISSLQMGK